MAIEGFVAVETVLHVYRLDEAVQGSNSLLRGEFHAGLVSRVSLDPCKDRQSPAPLPKGTWFDRTSSFVRASPCSTLLPARHGDAWRAPQAQFGPWTRSAACTVHVTWPGRGASIAAAVAALAASAQQAAGNTGHAPVISGVQAVSVRAGALLQRSAAEGGRFV